MSTFVYTPPVHDGLHIAFEDAWLLALIKPAGLLSVPGRGDAHYDSLLTRALQHTAPLHIIHRLDMATSGIILFAKQKEAEKAMSKLFQDRKISKIYHALVFGNTPSSGEIQLPLITDWPNRPKQKVDFDIGKPSTTQYQQLSYDAVSHSSRLQLIPVTGRSHQLRVHLMAIGHPIRGDRLYSPEEQRIGYNRLMLHASQLDFTHPFTQERITLQHSVPF